MATFAENMQRIFDQYTAEVDSSPVSLEDVARWALEKKMYYPAPRDIVKLCKEDLANSLRQQRRIDEKGRKYRAKHSVKVGIGGEQLYLWADIDNAPRSFMVKSLAQRRKAIIDDCFQAKMDVDHYNDLNSEQEPLQFVLDFSEDVAEMEAGRGKGAEDAA